MRIPLINITCLLPVCNAEATIEGAINSIRNQTFPPLELLIVDDGSTDATPLILEKYAAEAPIRILYLPKNTGIASALRLGVTEAKGDWIARMDADDWAHPDRLARQVTHLKENPNLKVIGTQVEYKGNRQKNVGYAHHVAWQNALCTHEELFANRFVDAPLAHPSVLFHKDTILHLGNYAEGPFPEDYELWLRLWAKGIRFGKVPTPLLHWRDLPQRLSRTHENYAMDAFYKLKAQFVGQELKAKGIHSIWIWGVGKEVYHKAYFLEEEGLEIAGFIDIKPTKKLYKGKPVVFFEDVPRLLKGQFILSYVANRKGRKAIAQFLTAHHGQAARDYYLMA